MMARLSIFLMMALACRAQIPAYPASEGWPLGSPLLPNERVAAALTFDDGSARDRSRFNIPVAVSNMTGSGPFGGQVWSNPTITGAGRTNYLDIVPAITLTNTGFTVSVWVWPKSASATVPQVILSRWLNTTVWSYRLYLYSGVSTWALGLQVGASAGGTQYSPANTLGPSNWYHIAWTGLGPTNNVWVNGELVITNRALNLRYYTATPTRIGNDASSPTVAWHGSIDDVVFVPDWVASDSEIKLLYQLGLAKPEHKGPPP